MQIYRRNTYEKGCFIMGLIKAALGSAGGILADQWREYFYCDSMSDDILAAKAVYASKISTTLSK